MVTPVQALRLFRINVTLIRHGLDEIIFAVPLFRPVRFLFRLLPWNWFGRKRAPLAVRIRRALEDLGPIFVKFGQMLSTRRDLLPPDVADELAKLQDQVPPFASAVAKRAVVAALGAPLDAIFARFDDAPLASASIAQVHSAMLKDGSDVVVKVLRPNVEKQVRRDLSLLYLSARLAERWWSDGRRLRPVEVVAQYEKTIIDELDLMREAASASQLRRNFENSELLYVPEVHWRYCSEKVMTIERIYGVPVSDVKELKRRGVDLKKLSENGVEIFFTQVFEHNFFHADMHPGNIFVSPDNPAQPKYLGVDFGIVGSLAPSDQTYLAENFLAFFQRDYARVAALHLESGWVPRNTRPDEFEAAIRTVCEPIFQRPLHEISFGHLLIRLFQTARRFNMEIQPQLILLQKTLLNVEGLGRQLYPQLDLWKTAKPFLERWTMRRRGPRAAVARLRRELPRALAALPELPRLAHRAVDAAAAAEQSAAARDRALRAEIRRAQRNVVAAVLAAAAAIAALLLLR